MHLRKPETFVFNLFEALFVKEFAKEISSFSMARNEGDYMLVDHKHKKNFYKTTKVRVSNDFVVMDLIARNLDTRVVSTNPIKVIIENSREKWFMNLVDQDLSQIYVFKTFYFLKYFLHDTIKHVVCMKITCLSTFQYT
uniref:Uncharacterized protein n=1 Tax=Lactuca sativa TaxID=4236 RepID=A0A9R1XSB2_LACSA|nr:hypothetical protein LSAT_V11C300149160 [Lactuca sativa]